MFVLQVLVLALLATYAYLPETYMEFEEFAVSEPPTYDGEAGFEIL
jgi:hypothetical protein